MVSHAGAVDPFWRAEFRGARDAAHALGVRLTILAPEAPNDFTRQLTLLADALDTAPAGIATTISHATAFGPLLHRARNEGIPVIAFNARPQDDDRDINPYLAFIGIDDYLAGEVLARRARDHLADGARVVVVVQQAGLTGLESRVEAIRNVLTGEGLILDKLDVGTDPNIAHNIFINYLRMHNDIGGVLSLGPAATHPLGRIIVRKNLPVYFAAFDLTPFTLRLIKDGVLDAAIDQQPYMQGNLAINLLVMTARYAMTPPDIDTGITVVDSSAVERLAPLTREGIR